MLLNYFEGQAAFLEDYKKVVKELNFDQQALVEDVMAQLNQPNLAEDLSYQVAPELTISGHSVKFPFRKELIANDMEATVSSKFFYEGAPFELEYSEGEQL